MKTKTNLLAATISAGLLVFGQSIAAPGGFGGPQGNQQGGSSLGGQQSGEQGGFPQGDSQQGGQQSGQQSGQQGGFQQGGSQQGGQQSGQQGGGQGGPQGTPDAASILERMDYDEDGIVTLDDFINHSVERAEKHFDRMDADEDGSVSEDEFSAKKTNRETDSSIDHDALKLCIETATGISLNERPTPEEAFAAADANDDGYISSSEFLNERSTHAEERFADLDGNADGELSEEEVETDLSQRETIRDAHQSCVSEQLLLDEASNNI